MIVPLLLEGLHLDNVDLDGRAKSMMEACWEAEEVGQSTACEFVKSKLLVGYGWLPGVPAG